jgi:hypothetical protein
MRVAIDHFLNFLRMDLQAANVNHTITATYEMITISPQLEHIPRVDEAVLIL